MKKNKPTTFNEKLERLESINEELDRDETELEKAIELYEEGIKLAAECLEALRTAELRITELKKELTTKNATGAVRESGEIFDND
jgi:exodeoxyribonuclease VII small subunit